LGNGAVHTRALDSLFLFLTAPPHSWAWFLALSFLVILRDRDRGLRAVLLAAIAVALADQIASGLIKPWADRLRPCFAMPDVRLLLLRQSRSPSFPSNHAANCFAAATVLATLGRRIRFLAFILATLVAYSRVYAGVHYPSDALGGALLGILVGRAVLAGGAALAGRVPATRGSLPPPTSRELNKLPKT